MGCSGDSVSVKNDNSQENLLNEDNNISETDKLYELLEIYIKFRQDIFNTNDNKKMYLAETDFFKEHLENLSINFLNNINFDELKEIIRSKNLKIIKKDITIINSKKELQNTNIEILNDVILNKLGLEEEKYKNKHFKYKIKSESDKIIEIIFNVGSNIYIKEEKNGLFVFYTNINEVSIKNSTNTQISSKTSETVNFNKSFCKINTKRNNNRNINKEELKESNDYYFQRNKKADSISNNMKLPNNGNMISFSMEKESQAFTVIGNLNLNNTIFENDFSSIKTKYELYNKYYKELFEELEFIDEFLCKSIDSKNYIKDYVVVNKSYFNKLTKLFESNTNYSNKGYIIDSFDKIITIDKLEININQLNERFKSLRNSIQFEMKEIENSKIKYPTKFVLIKKDLLLKFGINQNEMKFNIFPILFGENYLFIIDTKHINVCSKKDIFFKVNYIIKCKKRYYFEEELLPYIQSKGGFDYFFKKLGFNYNKNDTFKQFKEKDLLYEIIIVNYKENIQTEFLKLIIISLSNIIKVNNNSLNPLEENKNTSKDLTSLFFKFTRMKSNNYDNKFFNTIINDILGEINNIKYEKELNNLKDLLEIILNEIHKKLNSKNIINDTNEDEPINDNDKNYTFNLFKKNFDNQNESIIKKLFFGIILNTTIAKCKCLEKNYSCESSKYIYLKYENIENYNKLSDVLENWGISQINQFHCQRCNLECEACENKTFVEYPQILIIILNDTKSEKKKSIKFPSILNVLKFSYKYKIKIVISSKNKDSNFNIILKNEKNNWIVCDKDSNEEKNINNLNGWIKFPRVLFYEKIEKTNNELQESETEENYNNFFENSQKTESIMMNTRIKNSMDYLKEDDSGFELFKNSSINNKTTKDKIQLNNNLSIDKNKNKNITKLIKKPIYFSSNLDEIENKMNSENVNNININKSKENNCNNKALADDNINQNQSKNNNNNIAKAKLLIEENKEINNSNTNSFMNINNNMNDNNNNYLNHIDDSFNNINKDFMDIMYGNFKDDIINNNMNNINNNNLYNINNNCIISNNLNNNTNNKNKYNNIINFNNLNNNNLNVNNNKNIIINNINNNNYQICSYNFNDIQPIFDYKIKGIVGFNRIKSYQMNLLNNNIFLNNNQKNNSQLTKKKNNKEIELVFILSTGRKCYITLDNDNITFGNAVKMLMEKYEWINVTNSGQIKFLYSGSIISDFNKTVKQYGFKNGNIIAIIFEN